MWLAWWLHAVPCALVCALLCTQAGHAWDALHSLNWLLHARHLPSSLAMALASVSIAPSAAT